MADIDWRIALIQLSGSFRDAIGTLAAEVGAGVVEWNPNGAHSNPAGVNLILVLAGGEEANGLDQLVDLSGRSIPYYLVGAMPSHRIAATAVQRGANDYFALPGDFDLLRRTLERDAQAIHGRARASRLADAERRHSGFDAILGQSAVLRQTLDFAAQVAGFPDVTVLIQGETGTGKELLARAIHYDSPRAAEPFVEVNCAAIPANLLESELFGHERGAFTGATVAKPGLFELAHGGTVFLDEIGNLPHDLQPKVLRAIENRTIRRVGGQTVRQVNVRVLAATHVDLEAAVATGEFREDLYYRLAVVVLTLPPLRQRNGDVDLLADSFLARLAASHGVPVPCLTPEARTLLRSHPWPGNVRELRNAIERALVLSPSGTLRSELMLPARGRSSNGPGLLPFPADLLTLARAAAQAMLELTGGNKSEAARQLGISRRRLQRLLDGLTESMSDDDEIEEGEVDVSTDLVRGVAGAGNEHRM